MRNQILLAAVSAFVLTSVGTIPYVAGAAPSPAAMKNAGEKKDPAVADAAIAKAEAKDAKKQKHIAHKKAKLAHKKAKRAMRKADEAAKQTGKPVNPPA